MSGNEIVNAYVSMPKQMKDRGMNAEGYSSGSEYFRAMITAGESTLADLDPRMLNGTDSNTQSAASELDAIILEALTGDFAELDDILENGLQQQISERLLELAATEDSPVEQNGFEFRINE
ncbi:hypothetical protein [Halobellus sp. H-GB7]|uniref:hypothetical protein n=1 Tax=Halobellus sp. H-GB7 TaxID=3069756 RepID=UPI0027B3EA58|nr:hypothetical protein [Halobellus sp. H-GB7]MDQ2055531.1 hypothetical protein [Halobellus sp. H-GB7]